MRPYTVYNLKMWDLGKNSKYRARAQGRRAIADAVSEIEALHAVCDPACLFCLSSIPWEVTHE